MTKLASHLRLSRHGVYYYRVGFARQNGGKNPGFCVSLRTCDRRVAATLSYNITARLMPFRQVLRVNTDAESAGGGVGIDLMIREVKKFVQRCVARLRDGDASALAEPVANDVAALVDQTLVLEHQRTSVLATAAPLVPATLSGAGSQDVPAIIAQAFSQAFLTAVQALKAEAVTPAPSAPPPPIRLAGWDEAIVHWEGENAPSWAVKTKLDFPSAVRALRDWCLQQGIESPQQVTAEIMAEYKVYLATQYPNVRKRRTGQLGLGLATINKHLAAASSFFAAAKRAKCYSGHELPTKGLLYPRRKVRSKARPPLKLLYEEIAGLFEPATFLAWARKPHDRWVALILLYHGLRVSEASQLSTDDLRNPRGRWLLSVTDECENAVMKTEATRRTLPLHPALVALGFPAYVADVRRLFGDGLLFPYLSGQSKNGYGDVPGESLNKYICGVLKRERKTTHSFRHTVNQTLKDANIDEEIRSEYLGHEYMTTNSFDYADPLAPDPMARKVFPALQFDIDLAALKFRPGELDEALQSEMRRRNRQLSNKAAREVRAARARGKQG